MKVTNKRLESDWVLRVGPYTAPQVQRSAEVSMDRHQAIWNERFEKVLRDEHTLVGEPWLERWLELVPQCEGQRALDKALNIR